MDPPLHEDVFYGWVSYCESKFQASSCSSLSLGRHGALIVAAQPRAGGLQGIQPLGSGGLGGPNFVNAAAAVALMLLQGWAQKWAQGCENLVNVQYGHWLSGRCQIVSIYRPILGRPRHISIGRTLENFPAIWGRCVLQLDEQNPRNMRPTF